MSKKKRRLARPPRYQDFEFTRNATVVHIRVIPGEKIVYYSVVSQGPYFLEDMANMAQTWTKTAGWQFLPRPNPR